MSRLTLGILTLYLNNGGTLEERKIYEYMTSEGERLNIQIIVFTPSDVNKSEKTVRAHIYNTSIKKWTRKWVAIPKLVFDRCRIQKTHRMKELRHFKALFSDIHFLNKPFGNKWTIHQILDTSSFIKKYLPETIKYTNYKHLLTMLRKHNVIYLKPVNGTGGRGILRIQKTNEASVHIEGRDYERKIIPSRIVSLANLKEFISNWNVSAGTHLVQQGLELKLSNGRVHDYRILVQKNGTGMWSVTGGAGRIGAPRSITANLHGGGSAINMPRLIKHFVNPNLDISSIQDEINLLSVEIATFLEQNNYKLCELAIDIAIDKQGGIWIIELNPKPSREVFREIGEQELYLEAIRRPLEYAKYEYFARNLN